MSNERKRKERVKERGRQERENVVQKGVVGMQEGREGRRGSKLSKGCWGGKRVGKRQEWRRVSGKEKREGERVVKIRKAK